MIELRSPEPGVSGQDNGAHHGGVSLDLRIDGALIVSIFDEDAALEGVSRQALAQVYVAKIREAIEKYRSDRRPENIMWAALHALIATVVLVLALIVLRMVYRRLYTFTESLLRTRVRPLRIKSFEIVQAKTLWTTFTNGLRSIRIALILVLFYVYLYTVLALFPWTRRLAYNLLRYVVTPLEQIGSALLGYVPNLIFIAIVIVLSRYAYRLVRLFFLGIEKGRVEFPGFDREWARPTYKIVRLLMLVFVAVIIASIGHYLIFGPHRARVSPADPEILRFTPGERLVHLLALVSFVLLGITGMAFLFHLESPGSAIRTVHGWIGPLFVLAILGILVAWWKNALFVSCDKEWLFKLGGYLWIRGECPAEKFNAGQKLFYWMIVILGGATISATGVILLAGRGHSPSWVYTVHDVAAIAVIGGIIGHAYLSILANPGTIRSMLTGRVKRTWAEHHHPDWLKRIDRTGEGGTDGADRR